MANDAASALSRSFLQKLFSGPGDPKTGGKEPVLQILYLSQMSHDATRWKIALSDGDNAIQGMLSAQCSAMAEQKEIQVGNIVRLRQFTASNLKGKRIIIVLNLEVLQELGIVPKIGSPVTLGPSTAQQDQAAQQPGTISGQGFYGNNVKQETQTQKQSLPSRPMNSSHHANIYGIEMLSPYQSKWTIKARVTSKSPIKTWHNDRGQGKLFSINLLDETGEIRATAFNDQCDAYYDMIEEGSVYYLSAPCTVKMAQKKFNNLNNDYELTFERETVVEKAEEQQDVPKVRYNFTSVADLAQVDVESVVDTIGILREVGESLPITSKAGKTFQKRELTIVDETNFSVRLTIWGNTAQDFSIMPDSVVAFKGAKVSDFGGRSLSLLSSGTMTANPDIDEAYRLKGWYDAQGRSETFSDHQSMRAAGDGPSKGRQLKTIEQVKSENLGTEGAEYFSLKATTAYFFTQNTWAYPACPSPPETRCNKKVTDDSDGTWRCDACGFTAPEPQWRYILNLSISDHTGQCRVSCFDDIGKQIVGMEAKELKEISQSGEDEERQAWANATWNTYIFNCRATMDTYNDVENVRYTIVQANPIDYVKESKKLADLINSYG